jgi:transposase
MSRKKKFIENLSSEEQSQLELGLHTSSSPDYRKRCHAILLSHKGFPVSQIAEILSCTPQSLYNWFGKWEREGPEGLIRKAGQGRPKKLLLSDPIHVETVKKAVKDYPQSSAQILEAIKDKLGLEDISLRSLQRFLKKVVTDGNVFDEV